MARQTSKKSKPIRRRTVRTNPSVSDPVADMLTRIRNACLSRHQDVNVPASKLKIEIASILNREGYILGYQLVDRKRTIRMRLKYDSERRPIINGLKRVSTPGRRVYSGHRGVPRVMNGLGVAILTTSEGVLTDREAARKGIGGEVIGYVW